MQADPHPRSATFLALLLALAALACAGFVALGVWQLERLAWKEALISRVDAHLQAAPGEAPPASRWALLTRDADEYRRVRVHGRFDYGREVLVRAGTELGTGYWVLTPLRADDGAWLLVNRGFVPPGQRGQVPHGDPSQSVTGLLRFSEPDGALLQANAPAEGRWYSRDVAAIAGAQRLGGPVAPYFLDAQTLSAADGAVWPRPGLTVVKFHNSHLVYALTWFALAAIMAGAIGYLLVDERRLRRMVGATDCAIA